MVISTWYPKKTTLVWYNPITWGKRIWENLTESKGNEGHSIISSFIFCSALLGTWLFYILFIGWYRHFFKPKMWIGTREQVKEGFIDKHWQHAICTLAAEAIRCNEPGAVITIVTRSHWLYMCSSTDTARIFSPGYNGYYNGKEIT